MDEAIMEKIFEPFFSTKGLGVASGLGLSTVHGIVSQSGGAISVESRLNEGTTVRLHFPAVPEAKAVRPSERGGEGEALEGAGYTILLVQGESDVRELAAALLKGRGFQVLEATDGESALEVHQAYSGQIDLLITDVIMARMSGTDLAKRLLESHKDMRVLYMSRYMQEQRFKGINFEPPGDFIPKPFQGKQFLAKVEQILVHEPVH
jgi:two-component system cell cycle sensor histidine kinase/response regulator CckA